MSISDAVFISPTAWGIERRRRCICSLSCF
nr:MAG TPA: hypothetical protein [Bacteriophage sp.]